MIKRALKAAFDLFLICAILITVASAFGWFISTLIWGWGLNVDDIAIFTGSCVVVAFGFGFFMGAPFGITQYRKRHGIH